MKQLTPISKGLHFHCFKLILKGQVFMRYLQMNALQHTIKLMALHSFLRN